MCHDQTWTRCSLAPDKFASKMTGMMVNESLNKHEETMQYPKETSILNPWEALSSWAAKWGLKTKISQVDPTH